MVFVILAGLFSVCVCLLSVPVDLNFQFDSEKTPRLQLQIRWFFNVAVFGFPVKKRLWRKSRKRKKKKKTRTDMRAFLRLISRPLLFRSLDFLWKIYRTIHLRRLYADIRAGLGEPADTGVLFGAVSAMFSFLRTPDTVRVQWNPDFGGEPMLEGNSEGRLRLRPIALIPPVIVFIFSRPVLLTMKRGLQLWSGKKLTSETL